jgi:hypothetical protein
MAYSDFKSIGSVKLAFGLTTIEDVQFLPAACSVAPSEILTAVLAENLPLATASGSEKARSELIISPVLVEVRRRLDRKIGLFSGEDFTVDVEAKLSGRCDFLISRSAEQLEIEAPVVILIEAKQADLKLGLGQCVAEMVAAQRFNQARDKPLPVIYGCVSSGILWRFLKLEGTVVTIDLTDYAITPVVGEASHGVNRILGTLMWMAEKG